VIQRVGEIANGLGRKLKNKGGTSAAYRPEVLKRDYLTEQECPRPATLPPAEASNRPETGYWDLKPPRRLAELSADRTVTYRAFCVGSSPRAICVRFEDGWDWYWIPRALLWSGSDDLETGEEGRIVVPADYARERLPEPQEFED